MTQIDALRQIAENGPVTISQVPASRNTVLALRERKLIKAAGRVLTGKRGRPATAYTVSAKGERLLQRSA